MKTFIALFLILFSSVVMSEEVYECDFSGPNYLLTFHNNDSITLSNNFKVYNCFKGYENFPGTQVDLTVLDCTSNRDHQRFYFAVMSENQIILSKGFVFSKDISCLKK